MPSTVKLECRSVETAQAKYPQISTARSTSLSDRSDAERLNDRTTDPSRSTAEQTAASRAAAPFLVALSGRDEARVARSALGELGTYLSWVGP